jgi:two-component system heavy metal sensor histidine kinase CusS
MVETHFEEQDLHEFEGKLTLIRHTCRRRTRPNDLDQRSPAARGRPRRPSRPGRRGRRGGSAQTLFATPDAALLAPLLEKPAGFGPNRRGRRCGHGTGRTYRGLLATAADRHAARRSRHGRPRPDIGHHLEFLAAFRKRLWLAVVVCILLTALLGWVAARRGLAPVRDMARIAHGISASRLENRLPLDAVPEELTQLATAFNEMLGRLEDSFGACRISRRTWRTSCARRSAT